MVGHIIQRSPLVRKKKRRGTLWKRKKSKTPHAHVFYMMLQEAPKGKSSRKKKNDERSFNAPFSFVSKNC